MANVVVTQLIVDSSGAKLGVAEFTAAMDKAKRAAVEGGEATATSFERAQAKWTASLAKTDPVIKAQIAMEKDLQRQREIGANAVKLGIATQDAAAAQLSKVSQQHQAYIATIGGVGKATEQMAAKTQLAGHEMLNVTRQIHDTVVSLYSGQNPATVIVQQGSQVLDVAKSSGVSLTNIFKQVGSGAWAMVTPVTVTVAGVVALTAATAAAAIQMDRLQVSSQRAIGGAGQRTGTTVDDLNKFVGQNSGGLSGTGLSNKEARDLGEDFTKTGEIVISRLHGMSDAVVGFSNQSGQSMDEARKAMVGFAVDPKKALDELAQTYGSFDVATRKAVDALVLADDKTGAFQVVIDALAEKSKKAADNMGFFEKAARSIVNALATETGKPAGLEGQLAAAQQKLSQEGNGAARSSGSTARLRKDIEDLQSAIDKVNAQKAAAELNKLSTGADNADKALVPQIAQIEQLTKVIGDLDRARASGATSKYGTDVDNAAYQAAQNQVAALKDAQAEAARHNEQVAAISQSWGGVSQSTALALQAAQNELPVIQAITGDTQRAAQYAADYANALIAGKAPADALALAASNLEKSTAAAHTAARNTIDSLKDQLDVTKATSAAGKESAERAKDYRDAMRGGASEADAAEIAAGKAAIRTAEAAKAALEWQQNMLGVSAASQQAAQASADAAAAFERAAYAANKGAGISSDLISGRNGTFKPDVMTQSGSFGGGDGSGGGAYYKFGGGGKILDLGERLVNLNNRLAAITPASAVNDLVSRGDISGALSAAQRGGSVDLVDTITQLMNGQTSDKNAQAGNLQSELSWLQGQPETIARDQKIISLQQSIESLIKSTDGLNSTNQAALSPYYSQDPRTSHIGFRSQGMAMGGEFTVPGGYSANDNMVGTIPLASGEIVNVRRPGQSVDGGSSTTTFNISIPVTINGNASKDEVGRTMYQVGQTIQRQLAASGR